MLPECPKFPSARDRAEVWSARTVEVPRTSGSGLTLVGGTSRRSGAVDARRASTAPAGSTLLAERLENRRQPGELAIVGPRRTSRRKLNREPDIVARQRR